MATPGPRLLSGHETELVSNEDLKKIGQDVILYKSGLVRILPENWLYPGVTTRFLDRIYQMPINKDDVFVITFPKCGTTWMQEILWMMMYNPTIDTNMEAMKDPLWVRSFDIGLDFFFDNYKVAETGLNSVVEKFNKMCPGQNKEDGMVVQLVEKQPSPRLIKSHFPLQLLPKDLLNRCKVVYVARNPKDMMISFYHYACVATAGGYTGSLDKFTKEVINGNFMYCPYWPHVKEAWQERHHPNLHFTTYEAMKDDIMAELRSLNTFLGKNLTEEQLKKISEFTSFSSMKSRGEPIEKSFYDQDKWKKQGGMFRKGIKGDWKNHFSPELNTLMDKWIEDNMKGTDLKFSFGN